MATRPQTKSRAAARPKRKARGKNREAEPAAPKLEIHILDMGLTKFGDCIVVRTPSDLILIDGGHPGDHKPRAGEYPSIPAQLEQITGHPPPFSFDLLVVTHCHLDHIGCLPAMVDAGTISARWALVADERLGWGNTAIVADPLQDQPPAIRAAVAGLREEGPRFGTDADLHGFLADAASLESKYREMLVVLESRGTRIVRFGRDNPSALLRDFSSCGLEILGPSRAQLVACAEALAKATASSADALRQVVARGDANDSDALGLYRLARGDSGEDLALADANRMGDALNCQSIVLSMSVAGSAGRQRALLTGDLQFVRSAVPGIADEVAQLRKAIASRAPYYFAKIPHHGSDNAFDAAVLSEIDAPMWAISGGIRDSKHPARQTLEALAGAGDVSWARTDTNGRIGAYLDGERGSWRLSRSQRTNDTTPKTKADEQHDVLSAVVPTPVETPTIVAAVEQPALIARVEGRDDIVEVVTRLPRLATRVSLTIEVQPLDGASDRRETPMLAGEPIRPRPNAGGLDVAGGRAIKSRLLFVTEPKALSRNVGAAEAAQVLESLRAAAGDNLVRLAPGSTPLGCAQAVQERLKLSADRIAGVVLVGGYDVVPPLRLDVLSREHRQLLKSRNEWDGWIVWSDDPYGDTDGDAQAELPVSRVPDARDAQFLFTALSAGAPRRLGSFAGIRNSKRAFASAIWSSVGATADLLSSVPQLAETLPARHLAADGLYLMLHGDKDDARTFWGEGPNGDRPEAVRVANVVDCRGSVVFSGCCWGGLIARPTAWLWREGDQFEQRGPGESMALAFLSAGANAFVGPTGVHYSPDVPPYSAYGGPMHRSFWGYSAAGKSAAEALFLAKNDYFPAIPHSDDGKRLGPDGAAIEKKIAAEFTCLGLGW